MTRAISEVDEQNYDSAIIDLEAARSLDRNLGGLDRGFGLAFEGVSRWDDAIRAFDSAVDKDPKDAVALFGRARVYAALSDWTSASSDVSKAVALKKLSDTEQPRAERYKSVIAEIKEGRSEMLWSVRDVILVASNDGIYAYQDCGNPDECQIAEFSCAAENTNGIRATVIGVSGEDLAKWVVGDGPYSTIYLDGKEIAKSLVYQFSFSEEPGLWFFDVDLQTDILEAKSGEKIPGVLSFGTVGESKVDVPITADLRRSFTDCSKKE